MYISTGWITGVVYEGKQTRKEQCSDSTLRSGFFLEINMPNITFSTNTEKSLKYVFPTILLGLTELNRNFKSYIL